MPAVSTKVDRMRTSAMKPFVTTAERVIAAICPSLAIACDDSTEEEEVHEVILVDAKFC